MTYRTIAYVRVLTESALATKIVIPDGRWSWIPKSQIRDVNARAFPALFCYFELRSRIISENGDYSLGDLLWLDGRIDE